MSTKLENGKRKGNTIKVRARRSQDTKRAETAADNTQARQDSEKFPPVFVDDQDAVHAIFLSKSFLIINEVK